LRPYFPADTFVSLFQEEGKNPALTIRAFELLYTFGMIDSLQDPKPILEHFTEKAANVLGEERINLMKSIVRKRLLSWVSQEKFYPCFNLLKAIIHLNGNCDDDLILDAMSRDIIDNVFSSLKNSIDFGQDSERKLEQNPNTFQMIAGNARIDSLTYIFHTLAALIHGNEASICETFQVFPPAEIPSPRYISCIESNLASYFLSIRNLEKAAFSVKKAMLTSQGTNKRGGARAFRLYALLNAMQGNMTDAIEYVQFAADQAEHSKDWEELLIINYYASIIHLLFGNLSKAERLAELAESAAVKCGMILWGEKSCFIKGRILFEQGKYLNAFDAFESISLTSENEETLNAWKYRSKILSGNIPSNEIKNSGDGALFLLEAAYIHHDFEKAVALADALLNNLPENTFNVTEHIDWQSGFSQAELLIYPQKDLWFRLISMYRTLALSKLASKESAESAIENLQRVTRDEKLSDTDPNDAFYFFTHYQVLKNTNASEIDLNTAVSMAFKRLQRRASRIDDIETKRAFLSQNCWNKMLGEAAKRHKLI
jgi:tetratricopeptide (TPR) repeat protein